MSKKVKPQPTDLVKQSNKITTAMHDMSKLEAKAVLLAYSKFTEQDKEFQAYTFTLHDVAQAISLDTDDYRYLIDVLKKVQKKAMEVWEGEVWTSYMPLPTVIVNGTAKSVTFRLNPDLQKHFLELRREYTMFPAEFALRLQGKYSMRIYQLVVQWQGKADAKGFWNVKLDVAELRSMFKLKPDEYKLMARFRIDVIERSVAEINDAEIGLFITHGIPDKAGKRIEAFNLRVQQVKPGDAKRVAAPTKAEETDEQYIAKHLEAFDYWLKFVTEQNEFDFKPFQSEQTRQIMRRQEALKRLRDNKGKAGNV